MSLETDLVAVLQAVCPRVYPGEPPVNAQRPFIAWEHLGGDPLRYVDGTAATQRMALLQIDVWATTKTEAWSLSLAAEAALTGSSSFTARPLSAARGRTERDVEPTLYGASQDFEVLGAR